MQVSSMALCRELVAPCPELWLTGVISFSCCLEFHCTLYFSRKKLSKFEGYKRKKLNCL